MARFGFTFVSSPLDVQCALPFEIAQGLVLKRANVRQRKIIKKYLNELGGHYDNTAPFECDIEQIQVGRSTYEYRNHRLRSADWRYYVVTYPVRSPDPTYDLSSIKTLRAASNLTDYALRLGPSYFAGGLWTNFTSDWEYFTEIAVSGGNKISCDEGYLQDLKYCNDTFVKYHLVFPDVARSIQMYSELPDRRGYNELTTLGLFSVLESLLTHSPRGEIDSITHQIRKKITLVEKRLTRPIPYEFFHSAPPETIWKKLYEYRSKIAHGGAMDFNKPLKLLKSAYTVELFMKEAIRLLLRGAMQEPELFQDLRAV